MAQHPAQPQQTAEAYYSIRWNEISLIQNYFSSLGELNLGTWNF
jgi:hypothetical protein